MILTKGKVSCDIFPENYVAHISWMTQNILSPDLQNASRN